MNQKIKISILIIGLLTATQVFAVQITQLPEFSSQATTYQESYFQKFLRCGFSISCYREPLLGTSVTTISGSTLISAYPAIQNANVNALNDGKIENSTTSVASITALANLVSVGTLTSGTLGAGFTAVGVSTGGTGSTTLSFGQVLLGSTTNAVGIPSNSWGSSGQFLTSSGANNPPSWTSGSLDQTTNFNFTGAYFGVKNFNASSTSANPIILNGISLSTPSTQGAASSTLLTDGNGNLAWFTEDWQQLTDSTLGSATTSWSVQVPNRRIYHIYFSARITGSTAWGITYNNKNGTGDWLTRFSTNNGADAATSANNYCQMSAAQGSVDYNGFVVFNNASSTDKTATFQAQDFIPGSAPDRMDGVCARNDPTNAPIQTFDMFDGTNVLAGSRLIIFGSRN